MTTISTSSEHVQVATFAELQNLPEGTTATCPVRLWRKVWGVEWHVKDVTGRPLSVRFSIRALRAHLPLLHRGACLLLTGSVLEKDGANDPKLAVASVTEAQGEMRDRLEAISVRKREFDGNAGEYTRCNRKEFYQAYTEERIEPDDAFGQAVRRAFGKRIPKDAAFCKDLFAALIDHDWVHHGDKLIRKYWDGSDRQLLRALGDAGWLYHDDLRTTACVLPEIEEAMRREGWEYFVATAIDADGDQAEADDADDAIDDEDYEDHVRGAGGMDNAGEDPKKDTPQPQEKAPGWVAIKTPGEPFTGLSELPRMREFEMAVARAFGDMLAADKSLCVPLYEALSDSTWQNSAGERIAYGDMAADCLVTWLAGDDLALRYVARRPGRLAPDIEEAMRAQGWEYLGSDSLLGCPDMGNNDIMDVIERLYGERVYNDKAFCRVLYCTLRNIDWYREDGQMASFSGSKFLAGWLADRRCEGDHWDWYFADSDEGACISVAIMDELRAEGWHPSWYDPRYFRPGPGNDEFGAKTSVY